MKSQNTLLSLNPNAKVFKEIGIQQPGWWTLFRKDKDLYIDIRKEDSLNVYYFGGSVAKIEYKKGFVAKTHQKYLGDNKPRGKTKKGSDKFEYEQINLSKLTKNEVEKIKENIKKEYLRRNDNERPAEKWIQGKLITESKNYIDSELQFNKDPEIGKLRIDLIELLGDELSFVELKGIFDSRLRNDKKRNRKTPEIIEQMKKYQSFINNYETDIKNYYETLIEIKQMLGLTTFSNTKLNVNTTPKLLIANTYRKKTKQREERISDIKKLLEEHSIEYRIIRM